MCVCVCGRGGGGGGGVGPPVGCDVIQESFVSSLWSCFNYCYFGDTVASPLKSFWPIRLIRVVCLFFTVC